MGFRLLPDRVVICAKYQGAWIVVEVCDLTDFLQASAHAYVFASDG